MMTFLLWLFLLIVLPHIDLFIMSFRIEDDFGNSTWSVSNYLNFFKEPIYWLTFARTAAYSILVTVLTFIVALPVAFFITKVVDVRYKGFLTMLLLLPFSFFIHHQFFVSVSIAPIGQTTQEGGMTRFLFIAPTSQHFSLQLVHRVVQLWCVPKVVDVFLQGLFLSKLVLMERVAPLGG